jgi:hypothetical protein
MAVQQIELCLGLIQVLIFYLEETELVGKPGGGSGGRAP